MPPLALPNPNVSQRSSSSELSFTCSSARSVLSYLARFSRSQALSPSISTAPSSSTACLCRERLRRQAHRLSVRAVDLYHEIHGPASASSSRRGRTICKSSLSYGLLFSPPFFHRTVSSRNTAPVRVRIESAGAEEEAPRTNASHACADSLLQRALKTTKKGKRPHQHPSGVIVRLTCPHALSHNFYRMEDPARHGRTTAILPNPSSVRVSSM